MLSISCPDRDTLVYASIVVVYCICACIQLFRARSYEHGNVADVAPDTDVESKEECINSIANNTATKEKEEIRKEWEYDEKSGRIKLVDVEKDTQDEALRQKRLEWVNQSAHFMNRNELERVAEVLFNGTSTLKDFENRPLRQNTLACSSLFMECFGQEGRSGSMGWLDSLTTDGSRFMYSSRYAPIEPTVFGDAMTPEDTYINHNDVFNNCPLELGTDFQSGFTWQDVDYGSASTRGVRTVRGDADIILGDGEE
jgi:hypothetical protein